MAKVQVSKHFTMLLFIRFVAAILKQIKAIKREHKASTFFDEDVVRTHSKLFFEHEGPLGKYS